MPLSWVLDVIEFLAQVQYSLRKQVQYGHKVKQKVHSPAPCIEH